MWALASTPTFSHVYSGGRDLSVSAFKHGFHLFYLFLLLDDCLLSSQFFLAKSLSAVILDRLVNKRECAALHKRASHIAVSFA